MQRCQTPPELPHTFSLGAQEKKNARKNSDPHDFYLHLAEGKESLRRLGKRFGVSERTIRRWRDGKAKKGCTAEIRKDLKAPLCFDASLTFPLRTGEQVRVINVPENDTDIAIESLLNPLRVPLNALRKV